MMTLAVIDLMLIIGGLVVFLWHVVYEYNHTQIMKRLHEEHVARQNREWQEQLDSNPQLRRIIERSRLEAEIEHYNYFTQRKPTSHKKVNWKQEGF